MIKNKNLLLLLLTFLIVMSLKSAYSNYIFVSNENSDSITILDEKNKKIIKNTLYKQLKSSIKNKKNITAHGILEILEYENRQAK